MNEDGKFVKNYNEFWWFTDPEDFMFKHYPENN